MPKPDPIYTGENTKFAYQLMWNVAVFWKEPFNATVWLPQLKTQCEAAGLRTLQHRFTSNNSSLFLVSTRPETTGSEAVRGIKGRLQALVRTDRPNALRRNYELHSVGSTTRDKTEAYVARQVKHHDVDLERIRALNLNDLQWSNSDVDLGEYRFSSHGRFCCNLHVGLRFRERELPLPASDLERVRSVVRRAAEQHGFLLSRIGLLEGHLHLVLGISTTDSPQEVGLSLMNNIAWVFGMRSVLWRSCYAGTVGEYSVGAVQNDG